MKRKVMSVLLTAVLVMGVFTACAKSPEKVATTNETTNEKSTVTEVASTASAVVGETTTVQEGGIIGLSVMTLGAEFFTDLQKATEETFGKAGYTVTTASCEMDVAKQVSDIENLVTQGAKGIIVGPMDPKSLQDACIAARKEGTKIITFGGFENPEAYDVLIDANQVDLGSGCAELASNWVDKIFSTSADGSVETILITYPGTEQANQRIDGIKKIGENKKVKIVQTYELGSSDSTDKVQEFMEMALSQYPNLKCVMCYDSSFAVAANEVLSRTAGIDKTTIGIFAVGSSEAVLNNIKDSGENNSMIRGAIEIGGVAESAMVGWKEIQSNSVPVDKIVSVDYSKVNIDNVDEFLNK